MKQKFAEPEYVELFRKSHPKITHLAVERNILRNWKSEWSKEGKGPYGLTWSEHFLEYCALVFPKTDHHPFFVRMVESFERTYFIEGRKIGNLIGSASSGKTDFFATFGMGLLSIWPEYTAVYVAAPFLTAAESTVWGRFLTRMTDMKDANPALWDGVYHSRGRNRITVYDGSQTGFCELRTVDKVGKLQGTKSLNPERGILLLICDEIALFPTQDLLDLIQNLRNNDNFFCYTGCNFKDTEGLEGKFCQPEAKEYAELDMDDDQEWLSGQKSMTWRFDGHLQPNIIAKKVIYPYLMTEQNRQDMEDIHGLMGPKYLEQVRSFPNSQASDYYVTSRDKIRSGGGWDDFVFDQGIGTRIAFCDPGFGGDPCKIGVFEFSEAKVVDSSGQVHSTSLFMPIAAMETIKVEARLELNDLWKDRIRDVAGGEILVQDGNDVTIDQQIAVKAGEFLQRWGVARSHFGFDGSMRAGIVTEMIKILGSQVHAIDFGGKATDRTGDLTGQKRANELYGNFVTEMYFNMAQCIQAGQFRNAGLIEAAIAQICRRKWEEKGDRKQIESKKVYKKMNQGRSPDDADTLVGGFEMAMRKGFSTVSRGRPSNLGGIMRVIENMRTSEKFRPKTVKKLNSATV